MFLRDATIHVATANIHGNRDSFKMDVNEIVWSKKVLLN